MTLALTTCAASQVAGGQPAPSTESAEGTYGGTLPVSTGDLVEISVFGSPELSGRYRVSQKGDIDLVLAGPFRIAGLSSTEAASRVEGVLRNKRILLQPHVSVFVREYASLGVTIMGEVKAPGVYPALGQHRLYDLIAAAGGFTASASNEVTVLHVGSGQKESIELSNLALTDSKDDVALAPGDRVVVGSGGIVYVLGDVARPGGFIMSRTDPELTVLKAVSLAGGTNHTVKFSAATILHDTPQGLTHRDFDLKKLLKHEISDLSLHAGDVLYLPSSTAKIIGYRSLDAAFAAASGAAVYIH